MIYPKECSICTENVYSVSLNGMFCIYVEFIWSNVLVKIVFSYRFSVQKIYLLMRVEYWLGLLLYYCLFLHLGLVIFPLCVSSSNVACINIYKCCILLDWPLYYVMMFSLFTVFIYLIMSIDTSALFWFPFAWSISFHPSLSICLCPYMKSVSCRWHIDVSCLYPFPYSVSFYWRI